MRSALCASLLLFAPACERDVVRDAVATDTTVIVVQPSREPLLVAWETRARYGERWEGSQLEIDVELEGEADLAVRAELLTGFAADGAPTWSRGGRLKSGRLQSRLHRTITWDPALCEQLGCFNSGTLTVTLERLDDGAQEAQARVHVRLTSTDVNAPSEGLSAVELEAVP